MSGSPGRTRLRDAAQRYWGWATALAGVGLLAVVLYATDLRDVARHLARLSPIDVAVLTLIYFAGRLGGVVSWMFTMAVDPTPAWFARLLRVHLIGCAVERVTPLAGMGGEPVKLAILKRDYGVGLREATASLVLTRMTDLAAIVLFCVLGIVAAATLDADDTDLRRPALLGLAFVTLSAASTFAILRMRVGARVAPRLRRRWPARFSATERLGALADAVVDVETRLIEAHSLRPGRLLLSVAATFGEWLFEATLIYACLAFLELPVSAATAVSIAAFALAIRTAFFFVPADIGTQEAALAAICAALVGVPGVGLAIAAVIRFGELLWTATGVVIGVRYLAVRRRNRGGGSREIHAPKFRGERL